MTDGAAASWSAQGPQNRPSPDRRPWPWTCTGCWCAKPSLWSRSASTSGDCRAACTVFYRPLTNYQRYPTNFRPRPVPVFVFITGRGLVRFEVKRPSDYQLPTVVRSPSYQPVAPIHHLTTTTVHHATTPPQHHQHSTDGRARIYPALCELFRRRGVKVEADGARVVVASGSWIN